MTKHFFRTLFSGVALLLCLAMASVHAAEPEVERLSRTFPRATSDKIEVIEFFSYGCGHCRDFHPIIMKWAGALPADVSFRRIPVGWNRQWVNLSRLYYTLESLGDLKRLDNAVFDAIHKERRNDLITEKGATRWYVEKGGNAQKFTALYNSFGINSKVSQAESMVQQMKIESVPTLVVDGQYMIHDGEFGAILKTADQLIESARKK